MNEIVEKYNKEIKGLCEAFEEAKRGFAQEIDSFQTKLKVQE
jgi:hypothetical protein